MGGQARAATPSRKPRSVGQAASLLGWARSQPFGHSWTGRSRNPMRAMTVSRTGPAEGLPLSLREVPRPEVSAGEILVRGEACGVCRTDLHVVAGDLPGVAP